MDIPKCINCGEPVKIATEYAINGYSNPFKHALTELFRCEKPYLNPPGEMLPGGPAADCGLRVVVAQSVPV